MFDLLIKNARIVDGAGGPWYRGDVAVKDGKIAKIGAINEPAKEVVDANDRYLSPGFIDVHSHSDFTLPKANLAESRIFQGITTELGGDCGLSPAPITPEKVPLLKAYASFIDSGLNYEWSSMGEYLDAVEKTGHSTNFAMMVGHGTARLAVMGFDDRKPTAEELKEIKRLTRESMEQGAFGMSTGLIYPPGCFADGEEIAEVAHELKPFGGFYETHMRDEGAGVVGSVEEALEVGRRTGVPVQIVHHKVTNKANWLVACKATIAMIEKARLEGMDVTVDQYPYRASSTTLTSILPSWTYEGGLGRTIERLKDPDTRKRIESETNAGYHDRWDDILVSYLPAGKNSWMAGKTIAQIAAEQGKPPLDAAFDLLIEEDGAVGQITFGMCEEDIEYIMQRPYVMPGSDGAAMSFDDPGVPHPRNFGTFTRVLSHYCRDRKLFPLEEAIRKMTSLPAARIGLTDRGVIKTGMWADLVLFDFETVRDVPTFTDPKRASEGIERVYVNGVLTAQNGVHTGAKAGKVLRKGR